MGSDTRFDYSVIGDAVNLAARLEAATRNYKEENGGIVSTLYSSYTMEKLKTIKSVEVDKIKVKGSSESFRYYDATSGLLLREEGTEEAQGQSITSITEHSDYRAVNGVMIPFGRKITAGPQIIRFTATEVIINSEVSETDFK